MNQKTQYPRTGLVGWLSILKWEGMREVDRRNEGRVNMLALLWATSLMGVAALAAFLEPPQVAVWLLMTIPPTFGFLCLRAYLKLLREADEMLRQIQLEAMAVGFGTGLIGSMTFAVLEMPDTWGAAIVGASMCFAFSLRVVFAARQLARDAADNEMEDAR